MDMSMESLGEQHVATLSILFKPALTHQYQERRLQAEEFFARAVNASWEHQYFNVTALNQGRYKCDLESKTLTTLQPVRVGHLPARARSEYSGSARIRIVIFF